MNTTTDPSSPDMNNLPEPVRIALLLLRSAGIPAMLIATPPGKEPDTIRYISALVTPPAPSEIPEALRLAHLLTRDLDSLLLNGNDLVAYRSAQHQPEPPPASACTDCGLYGVQCPGHEDEDEDDLPELPAVPGDKVVH